LQALQLYSGSIGAFLLADNSQATDNMWCTQELLTAAKLLKLHNCYIRPYAELFATPNNILTHP
jgi:hypothetical protein